MNTNRNNAGPNAPAANVRVVLAWPDENRNIGSVCRAMKTMGIDELAIVSGGRRYDGNEVAVTAVHAADIFRSARFCETVQEAVADCSLAVAYTRRQGKYRKHASRSPEAVATRITGLSQGTAALVFGNEEHGLTTEQIDACHLACRIPTSPDYPSLNLSQAVQIACYEVFRASMAGPRDGFSPAEPAGAQQGLTSGESSPPTAGFTPVAADTVNGLAEEANAIVAEVGFSGAHDRNTSRLFVRDLLARAALNPREARRLFRLFRKIRYGMRSST